jgi:exopolysaccharide biosynthesis protein
MAASRFYSAGATFDELADILIAHGAYFGMSLDGGGSPRWSSKALMASLLS